MIKLECRFQSDYNSLISHWQVTVSALRGEEGAEGKLPAMAPLTPPLETKESLRHKYAHRTGSILFRDTQEYIKHRERFGYFWLVKCCCISGYLCWSYWLKNINKMQYMKHFSIICEWNVYVNLYEGIDFVASQNIFSNTPISLNRNHHTTQFLLYRNWPQGRWRLSRPIPVGRPVPPSMVWRTSSRLKYNGKNRQ